MIAIENKKVLVMAPHTDDMEFGCGGTVNKLLAQGNEVYCATFSACMQSVLKDFAADILITETKNAASIIGLKPDHLILFNYDVRTFNFNRQSILEDMIKLRKDLNPDIVFAPSINDIHQDHAVIAEETLRAFKSKTIFSYEMIWNNLSFQTTCFFELSEENLKAKINAVQSYASQAHRPYASEEFMRSLAVTRGVQIGVKYAECFEVQRINF